MDNTFPILPLTELRVLAKENALANETFRLWVKKNYRNADFDAKIHEVSATIAAQIDCTACAHCCNCLEPEISEEEVARLAALQQLSLQDFQATQIEKDERKSLHFMRAKPCIFLQGKKCSIYALRPMSCADFPHLHHTNMKYKLKSVLANYAVCPIIFHTIETLKQEMPATLTMK